MSEEVEKKGWVKGLFTRFRKEAPGSEQDTAPEAEIQADGPSPTDLAAALPNVSFNPKPFEPPSFEPPPFVPVFAPIAPPAPPAEIMPPAFRSPADFLAPPHVAPPPEIIHVPEIEAPDLIRSVPELDPPPQIMAVPEIAAPPELLKVPVVPAPEIPPLITLLDPSPLAKAEPASSGGLVVDSADWLGERREDSGDGQGWLTRLKTGLSRSSSRLTQGIGDLLTKRRLDGAALEELEELLISADLGVSTAARLAQFVTRKRFADDASSEDVRSALAEDIAQILLPVALPLEISDRKPHFVLVVGVNGSGKTTTIGKLAKQYREQGKSVMLVAGDTFRAAAVEQLQIWGERTGCPVVMRPNGADAAGLAYDALAQARAEGVDVVLMDTAGRLQNKANLMAELEKIIRVLRKTDPDAPHSCLLVLDATIGQNAHSQVEVFRNLTQVSGLVVTKLDGTARGGVVVALAEKFGLPVHFIGIGEQVDDLRPFEAEAYARSLMGLD